MLSDVSCKSIQAIYPTAKVGLLVRRQRHPVIATQLTVRDVRRGLRPHRMYQSLGRSRYQWLEGHAAVMAAAHFCPRSRRAPTTPGPRSTRAAMCHPCGYSSLARIMESTRPVRILTIPRTIVRCTARAARINIAPCTQRESGLRRVGGAGAQRPRGSCPQSARPPPPAICRPIPGEAPP